MSAEAKAITSDEVTPNPDIMPNTAEVPHDRLRATVAQRERFLDGCAAALLFYSPQPWNAERQAEWAKLTDNAQATTRGLCDFIRKCVELK